MLRDTTREVREADELDAEQKLLVVSLMHSSQADTIAVLESLHQMDEAKIARLEAEIERLRWQLEAAHDEIAELRYGAEGDLDDEYAYAVGSRYGGDLPYRP